MHSRTYKSLPTYLLINMYVYVAVCILLFIVIMDKYQEQPHLLDPHLEDFLGQMLDIVKNKETTMPVIHLTFKCLYLVSKVLLFLLRLLRWKWTVKFSFLQLNKNIKVLWLFFGIARGNKRTYAFIIHSNSHFKTVAQHCYICVSKITYIPKWKVEHLIGLLHSDIVYHLYSLLKNLLVRIALL